MLDIPFDSFLDIKKAHEEEGLWIVEGYAGAEGIDLEGDNVTPQAWRLSEKDLLQSSTVLFNHDLNRPIGKVLDCKVKKIGNEVALWVKVMVSKTAKDIWSQIKEGVINKFSIRGKILDAVKRFDRRTKQAINEIRQMRLFEVSLCTVPAQPKAEALRWYVQKALFNFEDSGGVIPVEGSPSKDRKNVSIPGINSNSGIGGKTILKGGVKKLKNILTKAEWEDAMDAEISLLKSIREKADDETIDLVDQLIEKAEAKKSAYPHSPEVIEKDLDVLAEVLGVEEVEKSAYTDFVKERMKEGMSMAEAAKEWKKRKEAQKYPYPKPSGVKKQYTEDEVQAMIEKAKEAVENSLKESLVAKAKEVEEKEAEKARILKEKEELAKRIEEIEKELKNEKIEKQVEEKWADMVEKTYSPDDGEVIKPIFKKIFSGEPLTLEESEALIEKKLTVAPLLSEGAGSGLKGKTLSKKEAAELGGIRIPSTQKE